MVETFEIFLLNVETAKLTLSFIPRRIQFFIIQMEFVTFHYFYRLYIFNIHSKPIFLIYIQCAPLLKTSSDFRKRLQVNKQFLYFYLFLNRSRFRRLDPTNTIRQASWASLSMIKPALSSAEVTNTRPDKVKKSCITPGSWIIKDFRLKSKV